jgi:hypothetical protein
VTTAKQSPSAIGARAFKRATSIVEQARRHSRFREPATQARGRTSRDQHDLLVAKLKVNRVTRLQMSTITQRLRDHHLPLRTYPTGHTSQV